MIPSLVNDFINEELDKINLIRDKIGYGTRHEIPDIMRVSNAYERLAGQLLELGRTLDAFIQLTRAAQCCLCCSSEHWIDMEDYETICNPLRSRFFAMFCRCKNMVRSNPELGFEWEKSGLQKSADSISYRYDWAI